MKCYKRIVKAGNRCFLEVYRSIRQIGKVYGRRRKAGITSEDQKIRNHIYAEKKLWWLLNANFEPGDLWVTFTHGVEVDEALCKQRWKNFVKKVGRYLHKQGKNPMVYIGVHEKARYWHTHVVLKGLDAAEVYKLWTYGRKKSEPLYLDGHYIKLAKYMLKNKRQKEPGERRWFQSTGLKRPQETVREISKKTYRRYLQGQRPRLKNYREVKVSQTINDITGQVLCVNYQKSQC